LYLWIFFFQIERHKVTGVYYREVGVTVFSRLSLKHRVTTKSYSTPECQVSGVHLGHSSPVLLHNPPVSRALFSSPIVFHKDKLRENRTALYSTAPK